MSATPLPWAGVVVFFVFFALWYLAWNSTYAARFRIGSAIALFALIVCICVMEYPFRKLPELTRVPGDHIAIVGDSISAGIDLRVPAWPFLLQQKTRLRVRNLSEAGATTSDAIKIAQHLDDEDRLVLIEIGGNDLISGLSTDQFARSLEIILSYVRIPGRTVIMMELPLLPHRIGYGQAQRRLARKYGVHLVPKRYFARVISGANATSDGLHLSEEGSRSMAQLVAEVIGQDQSEP
jgi:acyl-CoA thioesterase-1